LGRALFMSTQYNWGMTARRLRSASILIIIIAFISSGPVSVAQTRTVTTTVTNRSLCFYPSDPVFFLGYGTVQNYFTTYDGLPGFSRYDRISGGTLFGGEVRPRSGSPGVYEADYATYTLAGFLADTGSFAFQIPTTDSDANGLPDVVQIDKNGGIILAGSGLSDNGTPFSASGNISRAAGSATGTYRVNVVSATGLTNVTFTGSITLVAFTGTLSYQRGATNSMTVNVRYTLDSTSTVTVTTPFTVVNSDRIDVPQFTARSSNGASVVFRAGSLTRQGSAYRGDFQAIDGNPGTSWPDYLDWRWEISDPNDANGNGIPDLSDSFIAAPSILVQPSSVAVGAGSAASFSVSVSGTAPLSYQWRKNGIPILGATNATLTLSAAQNGDAGGYSVIVSNGAGSITSDSVTLGVVPIITAPAITLQPAAVTITAGGSASFTVSATGTATLYQWSKDTVPVAGATNTTLTFNSAQPGDAGSYTVVVSNAAGKTTSNTAALTVNVAAAISTQPINQTVNAGTTATFTAAATGTAPVIYQWRKDGTPITGATNSTLTLSSVQTSDAASYTVVVTNVAGSSTSNVAILGVNIPNPGRLINLSVLTDIATAGDDFTLGYVVGGGGTSGAKPLVIRAAGPSLGALGVPGTLDDPKLELFAGSTKTSENDNWGGSTSLSASLSAVGAFAYTGPASKDAATTASITTRDNSVKVSAVGSGTGTVIAEIYDATPTASFTTATPRLINVSVRKHLGSGLTMGFVVGGATPAKVLVRGIGPTLGAFGVPGTVVDPQLTLFNSSSIKIGENNDWAGTAELTAAFANVGAFALPATSKDAALLVTLAPGNYTAQVTGVNGTTGVALVEVYEVP